MKFQIIPVVISFFALATSFAQSKIVEGKIRVSGEILGIHKGLVLDFYHNRLIPAIENGRVTIRATEYANLEEKNLDPVILAKFIKKLHRRLVVNLSDSTISQDQETKFLSRYKKWLGLAVHGKLRFEGVLRMSYEPLPLGGLSSTELVIEKISGEHGDWENESAGLTTPIHQSLY